MKLLAYIVSWIGISGFIWVLFERADKVAKDEVRDSLSKFLRSLEVEQSINQWKNQFCLVFDTVFGERHLSWKCFWRSALTSFLAVILVSIIFFIVRIDYLNDLLGESRDMIPNIVIFLLAGAIFLNVIIDYLSLIETRWILNKFGHEPNLFRTISLLVFDLVATFVIYSCFALLMGFLISIMANVYELGGVEEFINSLRLEDFIELVNLF